MNGPPYGKKEIEKPKPIKERAAVAAEKLASVRDALSTLVGGPSFVHSALSEAIDVLYTVAGIAKK